MSRRVTITNEIVRLMCDICNITGYLEEVSIYLRTKRGNFKMILADNVVSELYRINSNGEMQKEELVTDNFFDVMKEIYKKNQMGMVENN